MNPDEPIEGGPVPSVRRPVTFERLAAELAEKIEAREGQPTAIVVIAWNNDRWRVASNASRKHAALVATEILRRWDGQAKTEKPTPDER